MTALLEVRRLQKHFPVAGNGVVQAVQDVSFAVAAGEVVGLVGESGSGKTTVGRMILRLIEPTSGQVRFDGTDVLAADQTALRKLRRRMQIIFQDPFASLNPTMSVRLARGRARTDRIVELLGRVGMPPEAMYRYPHEFSGGQRQRIGIARAVAVEPVFLVADEPVSALDVSVQAQVINLLQDLQEQFGLAMLFIAHDLAVVEHIADRVIVMYLGRIMEIAPSERLYAHPAHPYTAALLSAVPTPDPLVRPNRIVLSGDLPSPRNPPSGCVFRTRCPVALPACAEIVPPLTEVVPGHFKACIRDA